MAKKYVRLFVDENFARYVKIRAVTEGKSIMEYTRTIGLEDLEKREKDGKKKNWDFRL